MLAETERVGMFIHDSDHSYAHESFEFATIAPAAGDGAVLITDNVHGSDAFVDFCGARGVTPYVFVEQPGRHFYPGAGMGCVVLSSTHP